VGPLFKLIALMVCVAGCVAAQSGFVRSGGQAIPGASVTLVQNGQTLTTVTDRDGHYGFYSVAPGSWSVTIEMFGFDALKKDVDFSTSTGPVNFDIQLKPSQMMERMQRFAQGGGGAGGAAGPGGVRGSANPNGGGTNGNAAAGGQGSARARATDNSALDQEIQNELNSQQSGDMSTGATGSNDSFLISGSLSPGMSQGAQADSGPDMRFGGPGGPGGPGGQFGGGDQNGAAGGAPGGAPGFGGAAGGGGGFGGGGGGFGGGGGGGRGGGGGGGFGGGGRGGQGGQQGRRGQVAGAQFGNGRRRQQAIHGQASFTLQNSAVNAKPFSINGLDIPQAAYAQSRFSLIVGGPLVIKKLKDPKTQFFVTYFGTRAKTPQLFAENVPTAAERMGDFSQAIQSLGAAGSQPVTLYDPLTHQPLGNQIPASRLNPISVALLQRFYPMPNELGTENNYQFETASATNSDNLGVRLQRSITAKDRLSGNVQYQRRQGTTANAFGWADDSNGYGTNVTLGWTRNISTMLISNFQVRFNRNYSQATPYFSTLPDVSAALGISGTSTNPLNYGPPTLNFTNFGALSDGVPNLTRNQSQGFTEGVNWVKGVHNITIGGGYTRADLSTKTDPNGRGTLNFTGEATSELNSSGQVVTGTGFDLADFLLGTPQSSSIQYGEQTNYFQQNQANAYAQDEWKARSNLTLILGLRYEYFGPIQEKYGRIANLSVAPGFTSATEVTPATQGQPAALIYGDYKNFSPRLALAYKVPGTKKSTTIRAGYGIYYNGQIYNSFVQNLAKQPPFATSNALNTTSTNPLFIADPFGSTATVGFPTYGIDPHYRTPYAGSWNFSVQRELGKGFFADLTYLGTKGTRLDVKLIPNQGPSASELQTKSTSLYTYEESNGDSIFHAMQLRLNRRFNRGLSFQAFYQFAKSIDDSSSFGGAGNTTAQNWLDLSAERGLSSFDIRHQFTMGFVWTSPIAGPGSHVASDGKVGRLLKDWQISGNITAQTGNPLTARVLGNTAQLANTGGIGSGRASATGESIDAGSGLFNLAAFTAPASGTFGDAGRNTIPGPGTFSLNAAFARSFNLAERRRLEFRLETTNILNNVNYTNYYTVVNAANYGLPSSASGMRTLQAVVRLRF
jgi:hypothetical protein